MKGGYFTSLPADREKMGNLQLLGRLAALLGVTDQCPAFAVLPGAQPTLPWCDCPPYDVAQGIHFNECSRDRPWRRRSLVGRRVGDPE